MTGLVRCYTVPSEMCRSKSRKITCDATTAVSLNENMVDHQDSGKATFGI
jgi:hypothetical protein